MNKTRRNLITKELEGLNNALEAIRAHLSNLGALRDEELETFENLPEGLQNGEQGQRMEECADAISSALDGIESAIDDIDTAAQEIDAAASA